jgi:hypothetical protein
MPQRNIKADEFEEFKKEIQKRDMEILGLFSEQVEIASKLIGEQKRVNQSYKGIILNLEKRIRQLEFELLNFTSHSGLSNPMENLDDSDDSEK